MTEKGCTQKYFGAAQQIPEFAELRNLGKRDRTTGFKELVANGALPGLDGKPTSADQTDALMGKYEQAHPELLHTVEREAQFFGPKEIGGGKLDKFTKFVLVPAVRDAASEEQRKGVIFELINMIVLRQVNKRPDVRALKAEMAEKIATVFSQENLTELEALGESISELLEQYAPGSSLRLTWDDPVIPTISLPQANADLIEDDFPCPITHAGHGLQRSLVLTLLQYLALTERPTEDAEESEEHGNTAEAERLEEGKILSPDLILAIEEPELYLHPSRCRYLADLFLTLSKAPEDKNDPRNQIIYATHSPYFVDLHRFDQVRIVRKPMVEDLPAPASVVTQYTLEAAAKELARVANARPEQFTRDSFRARSLPVMTTAVNEGFFGRVVVVVEGLSDLGVLWAVQEHLAMGWHANGVVVVPALGKENLDRPVVVFRSLGIPTYFVFDADSHHQGTKSEKQTDRRNARYQRMANVEPVPFPRSQVHESWAVFEVDMERTIQDAVGEDFEGLARQAADELGYQGISDLMKNTEGAARLTELIYETGKAIPIVEKIVRNVSHLSSPGAAGRGRRAKDQPVPARGPASVSE